MKRLILCLLLFVMATTSVYASGDDELIHQECGCVTNSEGEVVSFCPDHELAPCQIYCPEKGCWGD